MESKLLPVSSLVKINDEQALVCGYTMIESDDKLVPSYIVLPYPQGFQDDESLKVIEVDRVELLKKGWETEGAEIVINYFEKLGEIASQISADEMNQYMEEARLILERDIQDE